MVIIDLENVFVNGFLLEYAYPSRLINQDLSTLLDDNLIIHKLEGRGMGLDWWPPCSMQGGWIENWWLFEL